MRRDRAAMEGVMITSSSELRRDAPRCPTRIRPLLRAIESAFRRRGPAASLILLLEDLHEELERHFDAEERGGYFADVRTAAPWLGARIDDLLGDHREFRTWSDELVGLARRLRDDPEGIDALEVSFEELSESLRNHEREEDELVREALQVDLGES
jgi:hypothetical protein